MSSHHEGETSLRLAERGTVGFQFIDQGGPDTFPQVATGTRESVCPNGGAVSLEWEAERFRQSPPPDLARLATDAAVQLADL